LKYLQKIRSIYQEIVQFTKDSLDLSKKIASYHTDIRPLNPHTTENYRFCQQKIALADPAKNAKLAGISLQNHSILY